MHPCKIHNRILDDIIKPVKAEECRMVVMDELTYPVKWGLVDVEKFFSDLLDGFLQPSFLETVQQKFHYEKTRLNEHRR